VGDPHNPVDVEAKIEATTNFIAKGVDIVTAAELKAKAMRRAFDEAHARAYLNAEGTLPEKKYKAILATLSEREAAEVAEVAFSDTERRAWALNHELGAWQSISKSVVAMYGAVKT
jgi:hypothetical protein